MIMPSGIHESEGKMQKKKKNTLQEDTEITIHQCAEKMCKKEMISL